MRMLFVLTAMGPMHIGGPFLCERSEVIVVHPSIEVEMLDRYKTTLSHHPE